MNKVAMNGDPTLTCQISHYVTGAGLNTAS